MAKISRTISVTVITATTNHDDVTIAPITVRTNVTQGKAKKLIEGTPEYINGKEIYPDLTYTVSIGFTLEKYEMELDKFIECAKLVD